MESGVKTNACPVCGRRENKRTQGDPKTMIVAGKLVEKGTKTRGIDAHEHFKLFVEGIELKKVIARLDEIIKEKDLEIRFLKASSEPERLGMFKEQAKEIERLKKIIKDKNREIWSLKTSNRDKDKMICFLGEQTRKLQRKLNAQTRAGVLHGEIARLENRKSRLEKQVRKLENERTGLSSFKRYNKEIGHLPKPTSHEALFAYCAQPSVMRGLGIRKFIKIQTWTPDFIAQMRDGKLKGIELEMKASQALGHRGKSEGIDMILCLVNDLRKWYLKLDGREIPIVEIKSCWKHGGAAPAIFRAVQM